jgi:hypothetical protein
MGPTFRRGASSDTAIKRVLCPLCPCSNVLCVCVCAMGVTPRPFPYITDHYQATRHLGILSSVMTSVGRPTSWPLRVTRGHAQLRVAEYQYILLLSLTKPSASSAEAYRTWGTADHHYMKQEWKMATRFPNTVFPILCNSLDYLFVYFRCRLFQS